MLGLRDRSLTWETNVLTFSSLRIRRNGSAPVGLLLTLPAYRQAHVLEIRQRDTRIAVVRETSKKTVVGLRVLLANLMAQQRLAVKMTQVPSFAVSLEGMVITLLSSVARLKLRT